MAGSLDIGPGGLEVSPSSSGRASPVPKRWKLHGADEPHTKDKVFRRYASGVERSLSLFDTALQEWADYISFLGRLLKSLQAHPSTINAVPSKAIVAKRLAQCLDPSLPSGVHQKAIEVYSFIFSMIGKDALSRDLPIYLPGLSSTLSFASLSTRAPFLDLLETHLLRVHPQSLRPALKAVILCLLPGLEEETSEDFDRTLKLLDGFKHAIRAPDGEDLDNDNNTGDEYFWQCFFLAAITSNGRRLGALAYLIRNLPKLGQSDSVDASTNGSQKGEVKSDSGLLAEIVTSPEPGLLLRCFAAGLADEQLLIQRGFLDLLVTHLPLNSGVLQKRVKSDDLELLITAAVGVVSRREMSLNRRLWTWLLGPEPAGGDTEGGLESPSSIAGDPLDAHSSRTRYFEEFGLQPLASALLKIIAHDTNNPVERAKPFRICLSLMDRWEIGGLVVPDIFLPIIDNVRRYKDVAASKTDFTEVVRSASVFFDGVESGLIWGEIIGLIVQSIGNPKLSSAEKIQKLSLVEFMIAHFNVREEEMLLVHAPLATLTVMTILEEPTERSPKQSGNDSEEVARLALSIAMDLIELIPSRAFQNRPDTSQSNAAAKTRNETTGEFSSSAIIQSIKRFYVQDQGNLDSYQPPFSLPEISKLLLRTTGNIICRSLSDSSASTDVGLKSRLFVLMLSKMPKGSTFDVSGIFSSMHNRLQERPQPPFLIYTSTILLATTLYSTNYISLRDLSNLVDPLVRSAWSYLGASNPKYHVEAVRHLWQLQIALPPSNREIEASICSLIIEHNVDGTFACRDADPGRRFSTLWTHTIQEHSGKLDRRSSRTPSTEPNQAGRGAGDGDYEVMLARPLFLMLDALQEERTQLFMTVRTWLQTLVSIDRLFHIFVAKLTSFAFLHDNTNDTANLHVYADGDDLDQCVYYLVTLSTILRWSSDSMWSALAETSISTDGTGMPLDSISVRDGETTLLRFFVHVCLRVISGQYDQRRSELSPGITRLHRTALSILHQILTSPHALQLADLELENDLIDQLSQSLERSDPFVQVLLLDVVFDSLKLRNASKPPSPVLSPTDRKRSMTLEPAHSTRRSVTTDSGDHYSRPIFPPPPPTLVKCLQAGFNSPSSRPVLDSWVSFLTECLPFYTETIFQIMIPLVETFCSQIEKTFIDLQGIFTNSDFNPEGSAAPETTLISLLNGLEHVLERGHDILLRDEARSPVVKTTEQQQGFFGNMVSGVFAAETSHARSATANNRLTILLSFHDAVRICFTIWSWGSVGSSTPDTESTASFNYTSLRMRNRARRLLEHLFLAEALECLEVMVELWQRSSTVLKSSVVFNLLHVLDGSRPKYTIPAIFDAIYSRTNPNALEPARKSTLTSSLADSDLVQFLVEYARSLEDDAMDEIWLDCMTFLKDILTNPFPHRQTLPHLLEFTAILGEKVDNTNFGEQRRMRRELGVSINSISSLLLIDEIQDLFLRLLTAIFTTRPMGFLESVNENDERSYANQVRSTDDVVGILASVASNLPKILIEQDRVLAAASTISASVINPTFKAKSFPDNVSKSTLVLLYQISRLPNTQKSWRKDLGDAFNDPRFFASAVPLVESDWLPLLRQWSLTDKERIPEILSRLQSPTTAGIVFGVGATSARLEADRKMQQNLRRMAVLILATMDDNFLTNLPAILQKIVELLGATTTSSPSSTTRADIYLLLRALILKFSPVHLATAWPIINSELQSAIESVAAPDHSVAADTFNNHAILQACKLLDTLLCIAPDDFQLHEWLYISDTIDAVYRPSNFQPSSLIDELSEDLGATALASTANVESANAVQAASSRNRRPLIGPTGISDEGSWERKDELVGKVLRPFFSQLSIFAFESTYSMGVPDLEACKTSLLKDLFDERSIVKAL